MRSVVAARRRARKVGVGLVAAAMLAVLVSGCSGGAGTSGGDHTASPAPNPSRTPTTVATRWWSNTAATVGSTIDPERPAAAAARLQGGRADYCRMLRQTVAAGESILAEAAADDPARLTSVKAFAAEIQAVAPKPVAESWRVLGPAVVALVGSRGDLSSVHGVDSTAVSKASATISADAKTNCDLDLSATGT